MFARFNLQERTRLEILERERQIKELEPKEDDIEVKKSIHIKYLKTKFKEANGHSRWSRQNSEERVERMYKRVFEKQQKIKENEEEEEKARKIEVELKSMFKPNLISDLSKLHKLEKQYKSKVEKTNLQKELAKVKTNNQNQQASKKTKDSVYERMQKDLNERRLRNKNRAQLK